MFSFFCSLFAVSISSLASHPLYCECVVTLLLLLLTLVLYDYIFFLDSLIYRRLSTLKFLTCFLLLFC